MKKDQSHTPPGYRPDIDGLRAVAVLLVIAYHAWPNFIKGGFIGVDVFFVISGYLISGIIVKNLSNGLFSLTDFYARRIRRIFPALIAVLVFCLVAGKFTLFKNEFQHLGKHVIAGAGFLSNILLWTEVSYWDGAAQEKPLLHLWSLGIEEQFYIIWPLTLMIFWKLWRNVSVPVIAGLIISFSLNAAFIHAKPSAVFYLPVTRLWELLMGALCALAANDHLGVWPKQMYLRVQSISWLSWIGIIFIVGPAFFLSSASFFPGWLALLPTVGAACIVSSSTHNWLNRNLFSLPFMVFVGLISYPLYLWHWPLLSLAHIIRPEGIPTLVLILLLTVTFFLSFFTYRYIESLRYSENSVAYLIGGMTAVIIVGTLVMNGNIHPQNVNPDVEKVIAAKADWEWPPKNANKHDLYYKFGEASESVLFFGDSNMIQYLPRIRKLAEGSTGKSAILLADGGCPPLPGIASAGEKCDKLVQEAHNLVDTLSIKRVVLGALWTASFVEPADPALNKELEANYKKLEKELRFFRNGGREVYLILDIPTGEEFEPSLFLNRGVFSAELRRDVPLPSRYDLEKRHSQIFKRIREIAKRAGVTVIDPFDYLCDAVHCPQRDTDGEFHYVNGNHLANAFVRKKVTYLDTTLQ